MSRKERSCFRDFRSACLSLKLIQMNNCLNIANKKIIMSFFKSSGDIQKKEGGPVQKPADLSDIIFLASNLFMHIFRMFVTHL